MHLIGRGRYARAAYPTVPRNATNAVNATNATNADVAERARSSDLIWMQGDGIDIVLDIATPDFVIGSAAPINPIIDGVERLLHVRGEFILRADAAFAAAARLDVTIDGNFGTRTTTGFTLVQSLNIFAGVEYEWPIPFDLLFASGVANAAPQTLFLTLAIAAFPAAGTVTVKTNKPIANVELVNPTVGTLVP